LLGAISRAGVQGWSADPQNDLSQDMSGGLTLLGHGGVCEREFGCDRHLQFCRHDSGV